MYPGWRVQLAVLLAPPPVNPSCVPRPPTAQARSSSVYSMYVHCECSCEDNVDDKCSVEHDFGGCFTHTHGRVTTSSCVDNFVAYKAAASRGFGLPEIAYCDCKQMPGCWEDGPDGTCKPTCGEAQCMSNLHTCSIKPPRGALAGENCWPRDVSCGGGA